MHPNDLHRIKAYVVFFIVSASLIGVLVFLYAPKSLYQSSLKSSAFSDGETAPISSVISTGDEQSDINESDNKPLDDLSKRRIRLTKTLLRFQKELQALELQRKDTTNGLDATVEQKIKVVREKIATTEKLITEIK